MSSTNRGADRRASDFYSTPLSAFTPLLGYLSSFSNYWEPACGDRRLIKAIRPILERGFTADGSDLSLGTDFLTDETRREVIITNPPFSLAFEFCQHAVAHADQVWMLLRLNFLASQKRSIWFKANEPAALFVLSKRPCFTDDGATDSCDYGWFYWGNRHQGFFHL